MIRSLVVVGAQSPGKRSFLMRLSPDSVGERARRES
jgi:hypothetical protein